MFFFREPQGGFRIGLSLAMFVNELSLSQRMDEECAACTFLGQSTLQKAREWCRAFFTPGDGIRILNPE
eukprot:scaffold10051_cov30-Attheya_sp.AAC.1